MLYTSDCLDIRVGDFAGSSALQFSFKGKLTTTVSQQATHSWREYMNRDSRRKLTLVWDCTLMTGFEIAAKREWLSALNATLPTVDKIIIISNNTLIRGAAHLMLKLLNVRYELYKTIQEVNYQTVNWIY